MLSTSEIPSARVALLISHGAGVTSLPARLLSTGTDTTVMRDMVAVIAAFRQTAADPTISLTPVQLQALQAQPELQAAGLHHHWPNAFVGNAGQLFKHLLGAKTTSTAATSWVIDLADQMELLDYASALTTANGVVLAQQDTKAASFIIDGVRPLSLAQRLANGRNNRKLAARLNGLSVPVFTASYAQWAEDTTRTLQRAQLFLGTPSQVSQKRVHQPWQVESLVSAV